MTTQTTAEQIAQRFGGDGQRFEAADGTGLDEACTKSGGRIEYQNGRGTDVYRYTFPDGSVLTVAGSAWDLGYAGCYCWQGAGHTDACRAEEE